jgi:EAL domain-containing protein (putative c-di-GMP-specific phosphodiesterase class I)
MITAIEIDEGLRRKEFLFHYQPKVSLVTGRIVGAEALVRWERNDGSLLPPSQFIPVAERSERIKRITRQLFPMLIEDMVSRNFCRDLTVSLNVSAQDFEDMELTQSILDAIMQDLVAPECFEIEITETQALLAGERVLRHISLLREAGVGVAMDDYGVGYSTIDSLSKWPFTSIKLDQGIVSRMLTSEKNATIVRSSIRLGYELHVHVVAEGVETEEQFRFLLESGCETMQGYFVSKPLPLDEFVAFQQGGSQCRSFPIGLVHMAIMDHVQWRRTIVSYALRLAALPPDSPLRLGDGYPELSPHKCNLGRWYFGPGQYFVAHALFASMEAPHQRLHDVGSRIVGQVQAGASQRDILPLLDELNQCSVLLVNILESLEDCGLADLYGDASEAKSSVWRAAHSFPWRS